MLCLSVELRLALTAGVTPRQRRMEADRMAAPQGPCPLSGGARLTGIESRDDAPRRMAMRHGGGRGAEEKVRGAEPLPAAHGYERRTEEGQRGVVAPYAADAACLRRSRLFSTLFYYRAEGKEFLTRRQSR